MAFAASYPLCGVQIRDFADLVFGIIIDIYLINVGGEPVRRRKRRTRGCYRAAGRLISGHRPQLFFSPVEGQPLLAVARGDFQILEWDGDVLLTDTKEAANTNDGRRDITATIYYEIGDIADLIFGIIIDIGLIDIRGEQTHHRTR
jgi:hypothetical protein